MIISKLSLPRRTFLRGVGATVALPFLDAMVPALSALSKTPTAAAPVRRLGFVYIPNGAVMQQWTPAEVGAGFELSPILSPLAPFRDQLVVVSGLAHGQAEPLGDGNGEHSRASATWLNGVHPNQTEGADVRAGITADQIAVLVHRQHPRRADHLPRLPPGYQCRGTLHPPDRRHGGHRPGRGHRQRRGGGHRLPRPQRPRPLHGSGGGPPRPRGRLAALPGGLQARRQTQRHPSRGRENSSAADR